MPWADPERNAEAVRRWRAAHPGYSRRYDRRRVPTISRYAVLDEDLAQQEALHRLSRRKCDEPSAFRARERQWIQATAFWAVDDELGAGRRRAGQPDEA